MGCGVTIAIGRQFSIRWRRHHRVIAVDLPGFGETKDSCIEYTGQFFAHSLARLLDQLGLENVALAGNSFGGQQASAMFYGSRIWMRSLIDACDSVPRLLAEEGS
jgi:pimeloyl-ACP methyl ester carboxylesterase